VVSFLQTVFLAIVMNSRAGVALLILDCFAIVYYLQGRVSIELFVAGVVVGCGLLFVLMQARNQTEKPGFDMVLKKTLLSRDMLDVSKYCHIINGVPKQLDYRRGEMLYAWMAAPIPTWYWPNKPAWANQGVIISQKIFGNKSERSGVPAGLIGELHWNFGLGGVWIGMFLAGLVYRQIFLSFFQVQLGPTSVLLYVMFATRFILFSLANDLGTGIVKAGLDLLPIYLVLFWIGVKETAVSETAQPHRALRWSDRLRRLQELAR
jgi:hypothetical protein